MWRLYDQRYWSKPKSDDLVKQHKNWHCLVVCYVQEWKNVDYQYSRRINDTTLQPRCINDAKNIKIIKTGIDPEPFLKRVYDNWSDWDWVAQQQNIGEIKIPMVSYH